MTTKNRNKVSAQGDSYGQEAVPMQPMTPPPIGGGGDYSPFVWSQLGEIQKSIGRLEALIQQSIDEGKRNSDDIEKIQSKIDGISHKIYAASVILAILLVVSGFIVNKSWDLMTEALTITTKSTEKPTVK